MTRSLVVAPQWIGDAVMSEPLLAALHARGEALTVAALPWVAPVYLAMPQVAEVIELPFAHGRFDWTARRRVAAGLHGRFDVAYVLPNSLKAALLPWLAGIPRRVGYHGEGRWLLLNRRFPNPTGRPPMVAFYGALAGSPLPADAAPRLRFDDATLGRVTAAAGVARGAYFAFAPGAEYGPAKRWPPHHFAKLGKQLAARGLAVWLIGSSRDEALGAEIATLSEGACRDLCGRTTLDEAIDLLASSTIVVSNDSGLMHVAAAVGKPVVALYGSSSPGFTPPLSAAAKIVRLDLPCSPCFKRECPLGHFNCMMQLAPDRVCAAIDFDKIRTEMH